MQSSPKKKFNAFYHADGGMKNDLSGVCRAIDSHVPMSRVPRSTHPGKKQNKGN
jgi:hypothetical protein